MKIASIDRSKHGVGVGRRRGEAEPPLGVGRGKRPVVATCAGWRPRSRPGAAAASMIVTARPDDCRSQTAVRLRHHVAWSRMGADQAGGRLGRAVRRGAGLDQDADGLSEPEARSGVDGPGVFQRENTKSGGHSNPLFPYVHAGRADVQVAFLRRSVQRRSRPDSRCPRAHSGRRTGRSRRTGEPDVELLVVVGVHGRSRRLCRCPPLGADPGQPGQPFHRGRSETARCQERGRPRGRR